MPKKFVQALFHRKSKSAGNDVKDEEEVTSVIENDEDTIFPPLSEARRLLLCDQRSASPPGENLWAFRVDDFTSRQDNSAKSSSMGT
ncbi:hypothetical protein RRG08_067225 [Elysia crispata]|uniref:Uncharacterized protein n=1 Tax=Elysia crispata TaxID=231223 RepID=A0AAE1DVD4_9GAST|nr:hypothetical protein RRG08_067225 [Elysia crispata]